MYQLDDKRIYSHSSLDLWRLCKRRWHRRYVRGVKGEASVNMAAGTWLVQEPVEDFERSKGLIHDTCLTNAIQRHDALIDGCWTKFLAEFDAPPDFDHALFDKNLAEAVLNAYRANPVPGKVISIEEMLQAELAPGVFYQSKPDFVVESWQESRLYRTAWDIKMKTFNQSRASDNYFLKPAIHPFDDQGYGQAVLAGCDSFGQIQFHIGKKDGVLHGPYYLEQQLDPILAEEWKDETIRTIREIDAHLALDPRTPWPKNPQSCAAFGRTCGGWQECQFGWVAGGAK